MENPSSVQSLVTAALSAAFCFKKGGMSALEKTMGIIVNSN